MYKQHLHLQIAKMLFVQAASALKVLGAEALPPFLRDGGLGQERLGVGSEDMAGDLKQAIRVAEDASGIALHRADGSHGGWATQKLRQNKKPLRLASCASFPHRRSLGKIEKRCEMPRDAASRQR